MGMCGGGGGGSDQQAQDQARIRAEQDRSIAALNELFGLGDPTQSIKYMPPTNTAFSITNRGADGGGQIHGNMCGGRIGNLPKDATYYDDKAAYDKAIADKRAELEGVKAQREANYRTAGQDILNLKMPQLDKQRDQAERQLGFQLARTGQVGGSLALDQGKELTDNYQRGLLDLNNEEQAAENNMRASDEQTRIDLINRIRSGMDQSSALASAQAQATSNINAARDSALGQSLQDYFAGMGYLYGQNQRQTAYNNMMRQLGYGTGTQADNGTISRSN